MLDSAYLRYDLYGRGYSDRPDVVYNKDLFDRQLFGLLAILDIHDRVDLVGNSMGASSARPLRPAIRKRSGR